MDQKTEKTIVGFVALVMALSIVFFVQNIFSVAVALSSPTASWKGGVPGTLSASQSLVIGKTIATAANSLEWSLPGETMTLLIASTPGEQEQGLGDVQSLASTAGMFFVFDTPSNYAFWMKGMEFPLDIIWLDQGFKIIHIEKDLSPSTYPETFLPEGPAKYVIEVNAGLADQFHLTVGETMQIYQK